MSKLPTPLAGKKKSLSLALASLLFLVALSSTVSADPIIKNYFQIWRYGVDETSLDVQRLENALYGEAEIVGVSIDNLDIILKDASLIGIPDLNGNSAPYNFDITGATSSGTGMYGYFSNPGSAYQLSDVTFGNQRIITRLFGTVWDNPNPQTVPEPAIPLLLAAGMLGLASIHRRRKS